MFTLAYRESVVCLLFWKETRRRSRVLSPHHRFAIAWHSPNGVIETRPRVCPAEKDYSATQTAWWSEVDSEPSVPVPSMPLRPHVSVTYWDFIPNRSSGGEAHSASPNDPGSGSCGWSKGEGLAIIGRSPPLGRTRDSQ